MKRLLYVCLGSVPAVLVSPMASASEPGNETPRIYGGEPSPTCGWPSTVSMSGGCTGTLVHPEVVIYAAHCGGGQSSVRFGERTNGSARVVPTVRCETNPAYLGDQSLGSGVDHAYCLLAEPQTDVPIVPILMGCEVGALVGGTPVVIAGFGETDTGQFGIKYQADTVFGFTSATNEAFVGGDGVDTCQGDSGGPVYVKLPDQGTGVGEADGTWRVFGITSYGSGCGGGGWYSMMHIGMPWFESALAGEGIDLTPCHDADGTWNPGPDCFGFPTDAAIAGGSWEGGCDPGPRAGYSSICGEPYAADPDDEAPDVSFTTPMDQERFETGAEDDIAIPIEVEITDAGWGVESVTLLIDGSEIAVDNVPPYRWSSVAFPAGQYTLGARGRDFAGNEALAEVNIGVDMDAIPMPAADDDGGTETGDEDPGVVNGKGCGCGLGSASISTRDRGASLGMLMLVALVRRRRRFSRTG